MIRISKHFPFCTESRRWCECGLKAMPNGPLRANGKRTARVWETVATLELL